LMLSGQRIRGFPCLLYPATCPSMMSRSNDPFAHITLPKQRRFNRRIVASSDLLSFSSTKTDRFFVFVLSIPFKCLYRRTQH
jgi:hypothetical protein